MLRWISTYKLINGEALSPNGLITTEQVDYWQFLYISDLIPLPFNQQVIEEARRVLEIDAGERQDFLRECGQVDWWNWISHLL